MASIQRIMTRPSSFQPTVDLETAQLGASEPKTNASEDDSISKESGERDFSSDGSGDRTERRLKSRHIQLMGMGGAIGTALFVQIGKGLLDGGPASLLLAFTIWCTFILCVSLSVAEMVTYLPISSPFIRFAGRFVDEAFGFAVGWNFFIFQAVLVPFEITACHLIIQYWTDTIPAAVTIGTVIAIYAAINIMPVHWYGEAEFWTSLGKVMLLVLLIAFTFVSMLGGNPQGERFGFKYWEDPGAFAELYTDGPLGKFLGFIACLNIASFSIAGPDYVSMSAGEAQNPRVVMPKAFRAVFYRLTAFFVLGSLAVGILVPYDDEQMRQAFGSDHPGAAASPYVLAMNRMRIRFLPHIVNAAVLTSAFSAGNSYMYYASRSIMGLALEGKAPRILAKFTKKGGVPIYAVTSVLVVSLLAFLGVSNGSARVLGWFVKLCTSSTLINFCTMCCTYLHFYRAMKAQGFERSSLPYVGPLPQPYAAWYGLVGCFVMAIGGGYAVFLPGRWDAQAFIFSYCMIGMFPLLFFSWKLLQRTKFHKPEEVDLLKDLEEIEKDEAGYVPLPARTMIARALDRVFG